MSDLNAAVRRLRHVQNQLGTNGIETRLQLRGDDLRAVLDALADQGKPQITEQMVEDGARALFEESQELNQENDWDDPLPDDWRDEWKDLARAVLEAALGKGQGR